MSEITDNIKRIYKTGGITTKIIFFNVIAFLFFYTINFIVIGYNQADLGIQQNLHWFSGTANLHELMRQPWSILTNLIIHDGLFHLLFNMIALYFFGKIYSQFEVNKTYISTYILSGLAGFFLYLVFMKVLPLPPAMSNSHIVGASGAVMGILGAAMAMAPNMKLNLRFFQPTLMVVGLVYVGLNVVRILSYGDNLGGSVSHLGGFGFGYLSVILAKRGLNLTGWLSALIGAFSGGFSKPKKANPKMKVKYRKKDFKSSASAKNQTDEEFNVSKKERQAKVDAILDKIKRSGYESLSKTEKDYLFNEGKRL